MWEMKTHIGLLIGVIFSTTSFITPHAAIERVWKLVGNQAVVKIDREK